MHANMTCEVSALLIFNSLAIDRFERLLRCTLWGRHGLLVKDTVFSLVVARIATIVNNHRLLVVGVENDPSDAVALLQRIWVAQTEPLEATRSLAKMFLSELLNLLSVDGGCDSLDQQSGLEGRFIANLTTLARKEVSYAEHF